MYRELHGLLIQQYLFFLMNIVDTLTHNSMNREFHLALLHIYYMIQIKTQTSFQNIFVTNRYKIKKTLQRILKAHNFISWCCASKISEINISKRNAPYSIHFQNYTLYNIRMLICQI